MAKTMRKNAAGIGKRNNDGIRIVVDELNLGKRGIGKVLKNLDKIVDNGKTVKF